MTRHQCSYAMLWHPYKTKFTCYTWYGWIDVYCSWRGVGHIRGAGIGQSSAFLCAQHENDDANNDSDDQQYDEKRNEAVMCATVVVIVFLPT